MSYQTQKIMNYDSNYFSDNVQKKGLKLLIELFQIEDDENEQLKILAVMIMTLCSKKFVSIKNRIQKIAVSIATQPTEL